jgi:type 1 glutamine amidotransferase
MTASPDVHSRVQRIEVKKENGTTQTAVIVQLAGYQDGEYVQLSGYATQRNGAIASITGVYEVHPNNGVVDLEVPVTPSKDFVEADEVTTFLWAAQAWLTDLDRDDDVKPPVIRAWKAVYSAPDYSTDGS